MVWPGACQSHWADKFDVIIPRQWTWSPVYGSRLCLTAPLSLHGWLVGLIWEQSVLLYVSCQFLLLWFCAYCEGSMVEERSDVQTCVRGDSTFHMELGCTSTSLHRLCCSLCDDQITFLRITVLMIRDCGVCLNSEVKLDPAAKA